MFVSVFKFCIFTHAWRFVYLQAEQEEIIKKRPPTQKGLTLKEYRDMEYLSKVHCSFDVSNKFRLYQHCIIICFLRWLMKRYASRHSLPLFSERRRRMSTLMVSNVLNFVVNCFQSILISHEKEKKFVSRLSHSQRLESPDMV